jgi:hypothetical protein
MDQPASTYAKPQVDLIHKWSEGQTTDKAVFGTELWDALGRVKSFNSQGKEQLACIKAFSQVYFQTLKNFAGGLRQCSQVLNSEQTWLSPSTGTDLPTLENSILGLIEYFDNLASEVESKVQHLIVDSAE